MILRPVSVSAPFPQNDVGAAGAFCARPLSGYGERMGEARGAKRISLGRDRWPVTKRRNGNRRFRRHVAAELDKAAAGGDTADVSIALRTALTLEGVARR